MIRERFRLWAAPTFALGCVAGVAFAHGSGFGFPLALFALLLGLALGAHACVARNGDYRARALLLGFGLLAFALGALRFDALDLPADPTLARAVGTAVILEGTVVDAPDRRADTAALVVRASSLVESGGPVSAEGRVRVSVPRYPEYRYGDRLRIKGTLSLPEAFQDPKTGRTVAYDRMLRAADVRFALFATDVALLERGVGDLVHTALFNMKDALLARLARTIDEPALALLAGLTLGERGGLGEVWRERFSATGLSHIVVLSGYNMTIVADWIGRALAFAMPGVRVAGGIVAIALFAIMAGGGAATVRAAIMAGIVLVARTRGKENVATRALVYAACAMALVSPRIVLDDLGFQLSFLASLGLIHLAPRFESAFAMVRVRWIRETLATTLAAQAAVLPLILGKIGVLSLVAPIANLAVLPLLPFAMVATFVTALFAFVIPFAAFLPGSLAQGIAEGVLGLVTIFAGVPLASVVVPPIPSVAVALLYAVLGGFVIRAARSARVRTALPSSSDSAKRAS